MKTSQLQPDTIYRGFSQFFCSDVCCCGYEATETGLDNGVELFAIDESDIRE